MLNGVRFGALKPWLCVNRRFQSSLYGRQTVLSTLKDRGLVKQISQPEEQLEQKLLNGGKIKLYCGADPTASSLHIGNLLPLMVLLHFYINGHDVVPLVGGATGRVGDPSGRKSARTDMDDSIRMYNVSRISKQLRTFFENGWKYYESRTPEESTKRRPGQVSVANNYDWMKDLGLLDFLATYGRHVRVQAMLSRDSVSSRLESQDGLAFNEFTYQLLQAFDFYHLYKEHSVSVQVGGSDQWGNITAGIDLISRIEPTSKANPAYGITVPLLTTSSGEKFGKSAGNAVFIDSEMTSSFQLYQFFVNTEDVDLPRLLKIFTLLPPKKIDEVLTKSSINRHLRFGQKYLAREVVDLIHGVGKGKDAESVSEILYGKPHSTYTARELIRLFSAAKNLHHAPIGTSLSDLITNLINCSKSGAKRRLQQGSVYVGFKRQKLTDDIFDLKPFLIDGQILILRIGKQNCFVVKFE
ncbi:HDR094Cp [Eremothecium sinecaudum]|uniref:Tyrosine--tRNA ligase n=1 Tax=Eremothecium sinecaudum TaxID=45286 RepID=A0A109UZ74_9SACH|nr:HDR094Cp [Eremothecium sinecaudum]AMD20836.1 HDR094Cp [Eremothecium sinecaudum]